MWFSQVGEGDAQRFARKVEMPSHRLLAHFHLPCNLLRGIPLDVVQNHREALPLTQARQRLVEPPPNLRLLGVIVRTGVWRRRVEWLRFSLAHTRRSNAIDRRVDDHSVKPRRAR